jgi:hypothetical protein
MSWWPKNNSRILVDVHVTNEQAGGGVDPAQLQEIRRLGESLRSKTAELAAALSSAGDKKE